MSIPLKTGCLVKSSDGTLAVHSHGTQRPLRAGAAVEAVVAVASDLRKPLQGGGPDSFDLVLGPQTSDVILGEEISQCLFEKGFCVLRCEENETATSSVKAMQDLAEDGQLGRLPEEVEEGYLGLGGKGRVLWLDPESKRDFHQALVALDQTLGVQLSFDPELVLIF